MFLKKRNKTKQNDEETEYPPAGVELQTFGV